MQKGRGGITESPRARTYRKSPSETDHPLPATPFRVQRSLAIRRYVLHRHFSLLYRGRVTSPIWYWYEKNQSFAGLSNFLRLSSGSRTLTRTESPEVNQAAQRLLADK